MSNRKKNKGKKTDLARTSGASPPSTTERLANDRDLDGVAQEFNEASLALKASHTAQGYRRLEAAIDAVRDAIEKKYGAGGPEFRLASAACADMRLYGQKHFGTGAVTRLKAVVTTIALLFTIGTAAGCADQVEPEPFVCPAPELLLDVACNDDASCVELTSHPEVAYSFAADADPACAKADWSQAITLVPGYRVIFTAATSCTFVYEAVEETSVDGVVCHRTVDVLYTHASGQ